MKKLVILLIVVVLAFAGYLTWRAYQPETHMALTDGEAPVADLAMSDEAAEAAVRSLDYEAIKALHDMDEVVMTVYGQDVTWEEYYGWLYMNAMQIEAYFEQMAMYYGLAADWSGSIGDGTGMTYGQLPASSVEQSLLNLSAIAELAADKGVELSAESLAALEDEALAKTVVGEEGTVEDLLASLEVMNMSLESYKRVSEMNLLYGDILTAEFGADCENVNEEDVALWLGEQGYTAANHILLMTTNRDTGEDLNEADAAAKKAQAEEIYAELSAIGDVEARIARFKELKEEFDEDTGKTYYPDGYTYTPGSMVSEFEDAVNAMEAYDLSEPVKSVYGWHVIMRMPLAADNLLTDSSGSLVPAGWVYAQEKLGAELGSYMDTSFVEYAEGFEAPDLTNFVK